MMVKKAAIGLVFVMLIVCGYPSVSLGLSGDAQKTLLKDATKFCPPDLMSYLKKHQGIVKKGMSFVDRTRVKVNPEQVQRVYTGLVKRMKSGRSTEYNTINAFGVLASFISEAMSPSDDRFCTDNTIIRYDGFQEVTDVQTRVSAFVEKCKPYWGDTRREVRNFLCNVAANEIADFWISAWKAGGHDVTKLCRVGLEIRHDPHVYSKPNQHAYRRPTQAQLEANRQRAARQQNERLDGLLKLLQITNLAKQLNQKKNPQRHYHTHHHYDNAPSSFDRTWHQWEVERQLGDINTKLRRMRYGW